MYEDTYWPEDAIHMERNSPNFIKRVHIINHNAEAVCDFANFLVRRHHKRFVLPQVADS